MRMPEPPRSKDLISRPKARLFLWGLPVALLVTTFWWEGGRGVTWPVGLLWMGAACLANATRCGRAHCLIMGPLFLLLGLLSVLKAAGILNVPWTYIGAMAGAGGCLSYLPEWAGKKYLRSDNKH